MLHSIHTLVNGTEATCSDDETCTPPDASKINSLYMYDTKYMWPEIKDVPTISDGRTESSNSKCPSPFHRVSVNTVNKHKALYISCRNVLLSFCDQSLYSM